VETNIQMKHCLVLSRYFDIEFIEHVSKGEKLKAKASSQVNCNIVSLRLNKIQYFRR